MNFTKNIHKMYELQCSELIYDCIILVLTPCIHLAKIQIIENFINSDLSKYISNFKPYKSRLELNIPLLQRNICHHLYSLLNQFYNVEENKTYHTIPGTEGTHEDVDDLVIKLCTILSNKILGKNIIKIIKPINPINTINLINSINTNNTNILYS